MEISKTLTLEITLSSEEIENIIIKHLKDSNEEVKKMGDEPIPTSIEFTSGGNNNAKAIVTFTKTK